MKKILAFVTLLDIIMPVCAVNHTDSMTVDEVVVTGTRHRTDVRYLPLTVSTIHREQIENSYEPSLMPLLSEQTPGMFVTSRGVMGYGVSTGASGSIKTRGIGNSPTTDVLVLIDGHPQFMGLMGHSLTDAYQSFLADKVEVVRGPSSVLYGSNAMGGVINIITRKTSAEGLRNHIRIGAGSYGTATTEYTGMMKEGKWNAVLAGSYNRTDNQRRNMGFEQMSGYAKLGYDISRQWHVAADMNVTHFNSSNPGTTSSPKTDNDMHITRGMTSVAIANESDNTSGAMTVFYNWGHHKINDGYEQGAQPKDYLFFSDDKMMGANLFQTINLFDGNRTTIGMDYQHTDGKAWNAYNSGEDTYLADKDADEVAGYIDMQQKLCSILTLDAGLRYDHHSICGNQWIPQVGMSIQCPRNSEIKAMVSKGFRNPTLKDLYMFKSKNPDLSPVNMMNYEISFHQSIMEGRLRYGINAFFIDAKNMIETVISNGTPQNQNSGALRNKGIEAEMAYRISNCLTANTNYSYLHTSEIVTAAPKHKLYVGADYDRGRWSAAGGVQWIYGLYTSTSPDDKDNYALVNLRLSCRAMNFLKLYIKGENLLAQHYEVNKGFPMPGATFMGGAEINF